MNPGSPAGGGGPSSSATAVSTAQSGSIGARNDGPPVWVWAAGLGVLFIVGLGFLFTLNRRGKKS